MHIAGAWALQSGQDAAKQYGVAVAVLGAACAYTFTKGVFSVNEFHAQWAIAACKAKPSSASGLCDLAPVGFKLLATLPASHWFAATTCDPRATRLLAHFHTPPPRVWAALHVARPDLYWLVATAWHRMKSVRGATLESLTAATEAVCAAEWQVDAHTQSFAQIVEVMRVAQIVAVPTAPGGARDIVIGGSNNHASVTLAPRDKMLAVIVLAYARAFDWATSAPACCPKPVADFLSLPLP